MKLRVVFDPVARNCRVFRDEKDITHRCFKIEFVAEVQGQTYIRVHQYASDWAGRIYAMDAAGPVAVVVDDFLIEGPFEVEVEAVQQKKTC